MIPKEQFLTLIEGIVAKKAPAEEMAFAIAGPQIADTLYANGQIDIETSSAPGEFQFIAEATQVLQFVALMAGTFSAVQKVLETFRGSRAAAAPREDLAPLWARELERSGVPSKMAREIAEAFAAELKEMLEEPEIKNQSASS